MNLVSKNNLISVVTLVLSGFSLRADFINGNFELDLRGSWSTSGSVSKAGSIGVITDDTPVNIIWQEIALEPGDYLLSFDFLSAPSPIVQTGHFNDTLFGTVYLNPKSDAIFNPLEPSGFSSIIPLLDSDSSGLLVYSGSVGLSVLGENWKKYTTKLSVTDENLILVMDLRDLNGIAGDSTVALDNIKVTVDAIPEPATCILSLSVGVLAIFRRRFTRNS